MPPGGAAPHRPPGDDEALDRQVASVLEHLADADIERASVLARQLARRYPRFALGQLLHAELSAQAALDGTLTGSERPWSPALIELLLEARARLDISTSAASAAAAPPPPFVQLGPDLEHLVTVDLARSRLVLYAVRDGRVTPLREHYVSSGSAGFGKRREGDRKTPLGLYRIVGYRDDEILPERYGAGALVLDYPNAHDRALGRTGSGIWLHGVERARSSRGPRSSEGCVTMSNDHLLALRARLDPATTLVMLTGHLERPSPTARAIARERYRMLFRSWRDARAESAQARRRALPRAPSPAALHALGGVTANDVTILESTVDGDPGPPSLVVMTFRLGHDRLTDVTLYWTRAANGDGWTLALEEFGGSDA